MKPSSMIPCAVILAVVATTVHAEIAFPVLKDINADGLNWTSGNAFIDGGSEYTQDTGASLDGNDVLVITQDITTACCHGAGFSISVSNGENGIDVSYDGENQEFPNDDVPNTEPANSVFTTIGNSSGRLENGNVVRFSAWFRSDPTDPIELDPQVQPVMKLEFWKEQSTNGDNTPGQIAPTFGDKLFDQDQHGGPLNIPDADQPQWIDIDGDGMVIDASAGAEGRISEINTETWTLVETEYTVNDVDWLFNFVEDDQGTVNRSYEVGDVEEIRGVMFMGSYDGRPLAGDGNLLIDNAMIEIFADAASVTPSTNPDPALDEVPEFLDADFNKDGVVDVLDLDILGANFNMAGDMSTGDANMDGMIDVLDLDILGSQFNMSSTDPPAAIAAPEPSTAGLALLIGFAAASRIRRRG